ncbi:hypothetical protein L3Y34_011881 [Caenorhabditis briggsae]|uniref:Uncharacterized protein n=1 Tax=Caenorhabditis briggsae TaxID=6238 RepID=A0AAE8ZQY7_CAEBR|nr:hypothetical protein L3Y34_011881 [Caenorhabditis briggsae]
MASAKNYRVEHELLPITKDVRPRPMMDWIEKKNEKKIAVEGSASPLWDDEDSDGFEGSGSGMPPIIIDRNPVKAVIQEDHPKNIDLSTNPKGPSVIVTEQGSQPDGSSTVSALTSLIIIAIIRFF